MNSAKGITREIAPALPRMRARLALALAVGGARAELYRSVGARVRARMTPSDGSHGLCSSAWWATWQALLAIQSAAIFELAALRLYAFVRESRRPRCTIPQVFILLETLTHLQRTVCFAVDPYQSRGVFSEDGASFWSIDLDALGRALFLVFFAQAADRAGIAAFVVARPWARVIIATVGVLLALDAISRAFLLGRAFIFARCEAHICLCLGWCAGLALSRAPPPSHPAARPPLCRLAALPQCSWCRSSSPRPCWPCMPTRTGSWCAS